MTLLELIHSFDRCAGWSDFSVLTFRSGSGPGIAEIGRRGLHNNRGFKPQMTRTECQSRPMFTQPRSHYGVEIFPARDKQTGCAEALPLPYTSCGSMCTLLYPLACAFGRMHRERGVVTIFMWRLWQCKKIWGIEMRGPQIMRDISHLLAEKVCCSMLLRPNRKVKGTALTASRCKSSIYIGASDFEFGAVHVGKA